MQYKCNINIYKITYIEEYDIAVLMISKKLKIKIMKDQMKQANRVEKLITFYSYKIKSDTFETSFSYL